MTNEQTMRDAFEAHWAHIRGEKKASRELHRHPLQPQCYVADNANRHWTTWQAAAKTPVSDVGVGVVLSSYTVDLDAVKKAERERADDYWAKAHKLSEELKKHLAVRPALETEPAKKPGTYLVVWEVKNSEGVVTDHWIATTNEEEAHEQYKTLIRRNDVYSASLCWPIRSTDYE